MNKIPIDEICHNSNEEIIPINEMEDRNQKVVIFDDYVCEKNQNDIINYFIQGRHKNCCVIYLSQSYYRTPKDIRINCSNITLFLKVLHNGRMKQYVMSMGWIRKHIRGGLKTSKIFCILINQERLSKGIFMRNYNTRVVPVNRRISQ